MRAADLRRTWATFWQDKDHTLVPSAGLIPHLGKYDPPSWKFEFFPRFAETDTWPPERLADEAHGWTHAGARIVGVGFGGGPEHVRALVKMRGATA